MTALLTFTDGQRGFTPRFDLRPNKQSRVLVGFHGSGQTVDSPVSVESKLSRCLPWRDTCFVLADGLRCSASRWRAAERHCAGCNIGWDPHHLTWAGIAADCVFMRAGVDRCHSWVSCCAGLVVCTAGVGGFQVPWRLPPALWALKGSAEVRCGVPRVP